MSFPRELLPAPETWGARLRVILAVVTWGRCGTRSLSDAARYALIRDAGLSARGRLSWIFWIHVRGPRSLPARAPALVALALIAFAAAPLSRGHALWDSDDDASTFLGLLWQVTAGTLGVAVAALIFLYESFGSATRRRRILSLSEFASRSGVTSLVGWLVVSLLLTGAVLLGWGDGAPMGWAALLAIIVAVYALLALPKAFRTAAALISPDRIQGMYQESIRPKVALAVGRDLLTIKMRELLDQAIAQENVQVDHMGAVPGLPKLVSPGSGLVTDVDLKRMREQLRLGQIDCVRIPLFYRTAKGDVVASAPNAESESEADFLRIVIQPRVGRRWDEFTLMKNLEQDGHEAIEAHDKTALGSCLQLHEEVVRTLIEFERDIALTALPSLSTNTDLTETVRHSLLRLQFAALTAGDADAAMQVTSATVGLMQAALDADDVRLAQGLLSAVGAMASQGVRRR